MNYKKIYDSIITRGQNRTLEGYKERHHIVPKCLGGTDEKDNLVDLTPEEHYVCHQLLVKIYPDEKGLVHAAQMMCAGRPNNKLYSWLKRRYNVICKARVGNKNPSYGTMWICNGVESKKISKEDDILEGWVKGRNLKKKICKSCSKEIYNTRSYYCSIICSGMYGKNRRVLLDEYVNSCISSGKILNEDVDKSYINTIIKLYIRYKKSGLPLRQFHKSINYSKSVMSISANFNRNIPEYKLKE